MCIHSVRFGAPDAIIAPGAGRQSKMADISTAYVVPSYCRHGRHAAARIPAALGSSVQRSERKYKGDKIRQLAGTTVLLRRHVGASPILAAMRSSPAQTVVYHDIVERSVWISQNEGKDWRMVDSIGHGEALIVMNHPHDNRIVRLLYECCRCLLL